MNGKIKTKFAALFAVALMITVCVVPVVGNEGTDAAPVSSSNGEVFEGYDITLYKEGGDYSGLVYYGATISAGLGAVAVEDTDGNETGYWVDAEGKLITVDMIPGYKVTKETYGFPLIQIVYGYADAFNKIDVDVKVEQGTRSWKFEFDQTNTTKSQGHFHIHMDKDAGHTDTLELNPEQMVGDFKVTLTGTQGFATETVTKTVNAGTATVVSGTMKDAGDAAIKSVFDSKGVFVRGLKVSYKIGGDDTTKSATVDKDGKFQIYVTPGQDVEITGYGYYVDDEEVKSNDVKPYTFSGIPYSFGTVNSSIPKEFKANEYTRTVTLNTADSKVINGTATLGLTWYSQTYNSSEGIYTTATADGKAIQLNTQTDNGKIDVAYKAPENAFTSETTYEYFLIVDLENSGNFTFDTKSVNEDNKKSISSNISGAGGTKNATEQNVTLKAKESIFTVKVQSKNNNPVVGASIIVSWYSQKAGTSEGKYNIASVGADKGKAVKLDNSDADGRITVAYIKPAAVEGTTFYLYMSVGADNSDTAYCGYKFNIGSITVSENSDSISTQLNGKAASKAITSIEDTTLNAKENSYKVSGNVIYKDAEVSYTNGIDDEDEAVVDKDGKYSFYILEGKSTEITPTKGGVTFVPSSFVTPSLSGNLTVDFAKMAPPIQPKDLEYVLDTNATEGTDVTFNYKVNGDEYTQIIETVGSATASKATLIISAMPGDVIEVSASMNGYQISAFDGYSAKALKVYTNGYKIVDGLENAIPGATFGISYVDANGVTKIKQMTADENGLAVWSDIYEPGAMYKDGLYVAPESGSYEEIYDMETLEKVGYMSYDLGEYYQVGKGNVSIRYMSAYNSDSQFGAPVAYESIAPSKTLTGVIVGEKIALKAPSIDNFEFVAWMVDGVVVSESADYTLVVEDGKSAYDAVALYSAVHYEEPAEGLSMNVLVIGIVILILGILAVAYGIISKKQ